MFSLTVDKQNITFIPIISSNTELCYQPQICKYQWYQVQQNDKIIGNIESHFIDKWLEMNNLPMKFRTNYILVYGYKSNDKTDLHEFIYKFSYDNETYWIYKNSGLIDQHDVRCYPKDLQRMIHKHYEENDILSIGTGFYVYAQTAQHWQYMKYSALNEWLESKNENFRVENDSLFGESDDDW